MPFPCNLYVRNAAYAVEATRVRRHSMAVISRFVFLSLLFAFFISIDTKCIPGGDSIFFSSTTTSRSIFQLKSTRNVNCFLVTGVAGYIGSHMALRLLEMGECVVGVDNLSRGSQKAVDVLTTHENFFFELIDLGDAGAVQRLFLFHRFHTVIHFAAIAFTGESVDYPDLYRSNITINTQHLVNTMVKHEVPSLLYSSTCAVYGNPGRHEFPITETTQTSPVSPYGQAKLDAEAFIRSKVSSNFTAKILRYFNVVGADSKGRLQERPRPELGRYARLWTACLDVVFERRPCVTLDDSLETPDGTAIRDYVHVEDLVQAHLEALSISSPLNSFEVWNVATNQPTSVMEFIEAARRVTGAFIPVCFRERTGQDSHNPPKLYASGERLRQMTKWRPRFTDIAGMLETAWNTQNKPDDKASTQHDVCIVGAGLSAAVLAERHSTTFNHSVLVIEKRDHIGGNCFDYIDKETGIRVGKYGLHLFHTKYDRVWSYIQQFSNWTKWEHQCIAKVGDKYIPFPVNIDSVNALFNLSISSEEEMDSWLGKSQILPQKGNAVNSEEVALQRVGRELYELIFEPYTIKQWNKRPRELGPSVLSRISVRINHDDRYFTDPHQALPSRGYTRLFERMFSSPLITIRLNTDYFNVREEVQCNHVYFTGPIDAYFANQGLPKLEYRSLEFERKVHRDTAYYQPKAHVNYPAMVYNFTRAIEYKHILQQESPHTVVFFERSTDVGEPYYPVPNKENHELYAKYQRMAEQEGKVDFVGWLANYKYFNMDQTILNALELFDQRFSGVASN